MAFLPFLGKKCGFFGDGGSKKLNNLLQNIAKDVLFESSTLQIGWGAI